MDGLLDVLIKQFGGQIGGVLLNSLGGNAAQTGGGDSAASQIIQSYVAQNAGLVTNSAVPAVAPGGGLLDMLTSALPMLLGVTQNNANMVQEISGAYNQPLNNLGLINVLTSAFDISSKGISFKGGDAVMRSLSTTAVSQAVLFIANKTGSSFLANAASRLVPILAPLAMTAWSAYQTNKTGQNASNILRSPMRQSNEPPIDDLELSNYVIELPAENVRYHKCLILSNLMKIDGKADRSELTHIEKIIEGLEFNSDTLEDLYGKLDSPERHSPNFLLVAENNDEVIGLLVDLVALTKKDGTVGAAEKDYILQVGREFSIEAQEIEVMF